MNREELVRDRGKSWKRLAELLRNTESTRGVRKLPPEEVREMSELYRSLAGDLMRVQRDKLGADLERHLHGLAGRAHNAIYAGSQVGNRFKFVDLFADFPCAVRRNLRCFLIAFGLFYGPFFLAAAASYTDESYALAVMSGPQLEKMEEMYSKAASGRDANTDAAMTGFYVQNNVGIAFRCFATGLAFGLGSIFFLMFNGLSIGTVFGHLHRTGYGDNLLSFVSSHSSWELTAIVISGAAGLQMGYALVSTHGRTRLGNLQAHGLELLRQIVGAAAFLFLAALIEAWVSPSALPREFKFAFGIAGWAIVFGILAFMGRARPPPEDVLALRGERLE